MTSPASSDLLHFVRGTLGCKCPDEVFQSVALDRQQDHTRLMIGDRLLIYVVEVATDSAAGKSVSLLASRGLEDRNSKRLNRFRLVVATPEPTPRLEEAKAAFAAVAGNDDRAHLHLIATGQLPAELRRIAVATVVPYDSTIFQDDPQPADNER